MRLQLLILALPSALQDAQGRVDMLAELGCCGLQFCRDVAGMWLRSSGEHPLGCTPHQLPPTGQMTEATSTRRVATLFGGLSPAPSIYTHLQATALTHWRDRERRHLHELAQGLPGR